MFKYAEAAQKDNMTFGIGLGSNLNTDGIDREAQCSAPMTRR